MKHLPAFFLSLCLSTLSIQAADLNVVTIDVGAILKEYPAADEFETNMKAKADEFRSARARGIEQMKKHEAAYLAARKDSRSAVFSEAKRLEKMKEAEESLIAYKELEIKMRESRVKDSKMLNEFRTAAFKEVIEKLKSEIQAFSEKNKYDLVLDSSGVTLRGVESLLYSAKSLDITDAFLKEINTGAPK